MPTKRGRVVLVRLQDILRYVPGTAQSLSLPSVLVALLALVSPYEYKNSYRGWGLLGQRPVAIGDCARGLY